MGFGLRKIANRGSGYTLLAKPQRGSTDLNDFFAAGLRPAAKNQLSASSFCGCDFRERG